MAADDYAVLVGISRYPQLGENRTALSLRGPEDDVKAVADWLVGSGEVPDDAEHVRIVTSRTIAGVAAQPLEPATHHLTGALSAFDRISENNVNQGLGPQVGRRLYVYMSGHGFSPARRRGCLITADANATQTWNVDVSAWTDWFQDMGYFRELVLWMDCCMDRISLVPPSGPAAQPGAAPAPAGPSFVAFAAQRPLRAVEVEVGGQGQWHGAFTWALLEGLKGAAVDRYQRVTGRSLADWVRNAQGALLGEEDLNDPDVSKEPDVIKEDEPLIFAEGIAPRSYAVKLRFAPGAVGKTAGLWSGLPPRRERLDITGVEVTLGLRPGLYLVEVPELGLRQGFEVLGPVTVTIREQGPPVLEPRPGSVFNLVVVSDEATEIHLIDTLFAKIKGSPRRLSAKLPFGLYKIKTRLGRGVTDRVVLLDDDGQPKAGKAYQTLKLPTAAPLMAGHMHHEFHVEAARSLGMRLGRRARSGVAILSRVWSHDGTSDAEAAGGIHLVNAQGEILLDLAATGRLDKDQNNGGDAVISAGVAVDPGVYYLRHYLDDGTEIEQSIVAVEGWVTEVYCLQPVPDHVSRSVDGTKPIRARRLMSTHMRDIKAARKAAFDETAYLAVEASAVALADERHILNPELEELLLRKSENPIAGIIGAHLVLIEADRQRRANINVLNEVVRNLRRLVGEGHPDVEALATRCPDATLRPQKPLAGPPMFQRSWFLLVEASGERPALLPAAVARRVEARGTIPLFLGWAPDATVKAASHRALARAIWSAEGATPPLSLPTTGRPERTSTPSAAIATASGAMELPAGLSPAGATSSAGMVDPKVARQRAKQLHIPVSALESLRREAAAQGAAAARPPVDDPPLPGARRPRPQARG